MVFFLAVPPALFTGHAGKASSFASSEISLNWFPSSGFALMEGLSFSLVIWRLLKSLGIGLQDQALPLLNPK